MYEYSNNYCSKFDEFFFYHHLHNQPYIPIYIRNREKLVKSQYYIRIVTVISSYSVVYTKKDDYYYINVLDRILLLRYIIWSQQSLIQHSNHATAYTYT